MPPLRGLLSDYNFFYGYRNFRAIIISALRAYRLRNDLIAPILLSHIRPIIISALRAYRFVTISLVQICHPIIYFSPIPKG